MGNWSELHSEKKYILHTWKIGTLTRTLTLYHHFLQHSQNFGRLGIPNRRIDTHLVDDISEEGIYHSWVKIRTYVKMSWNSDGNHLKSDLRHGSDQTDGTSLKKLVNIHYSQCKTETLTVECIT